LYGGSIIRRIKTKNTDSDSLEFFVLIHLFTCLQTHRTKTRKSAECNSSAEVLPVFVQGFDECHDDCNVPLRGISIVQLNTEANHSTGTESQELEDPTTPQVHPSCLRSASSLHVVVVESFDSWLAAWVGISTKGKRSTVVEEQATRLSDLCCRGRCEWCISSAPEKRGSEAAVLRASRISCCRKCWSASGQMVAVTGEFSFVLCSDPPAILQIHACAPQLICVCLLFPRLASAPAFDEDTHTSPCPATYRVSSHACVSPTVVGIAGS